MIKYDDADDVKEKVGEVVARLGFSHIKLDRINCIRSSGSASRRVTARCHALPRIMQKALNAGAHYIIEVISERFDKLPEEEKMKTLIHELLHIPKSFGGGFIHHNIVNSRSVEKFWNKYKEIKS